MADSVLIDIKKHEPSRGGGRDLRPAHWSVRVEGRCVDSFLSKTRAAAKAKALRAALSRA